MIKLKLKKGFNNLKVVFVGSEGTVVRDHSLPSGIIKKRELHHKPQLQVGKYYTLQRTTTLLSRGMLFQCKDVTAAELRVVDNYAKLFDVLQSLARCGRDKDKLKSLNWLKNWGE